MVGGREGEDGRGRDGGEIRDRGRKAGRREVRGKDSII